MAIVHWEPLREIETLQREMNQLFDGLTPSTMRRGLGTSFIPAAELSETPEAIQLKVELPGMDAKDLDVQVTAEAVSISGERKSEARTEQDGVVRSEFRYGKFHRVIPLPSRVQNDQVTADYKDGVLNLNLPKVDAYFTVIGSSAGDEAREADTLLAFLDSDHAYHGTGVVINSFEGWAAGGMGRVVDTLPSIIDPGPSEASKM